MSHAYSLRMRDVCDLEDCRECFEASCDFFETRNGDESIFDFRTDREKEDDLRIESLMTGIADDLDYFHHEEKRITALFVEPQSVPRQMYRTSTKAMTGGYWGGLRYCSAATKRELKQQASRGRRRMGRHLIQESRAQGFDHDLDLVRIR